MGIDRALACFATAAKLIILAIVIVPAGEVVSRAIGRQGSARLSKIDFAGLKHYTSEQAVTASGLQLGSQVTNADFQQAATRMLQAGLFKKVSYQYRTLGGKAEVTFEVEEAKWGVPVVFDNFIWFTDDELAAAVRTVLPSFDGTAPDSGGVLDAITQALDKLLGGRKLPYSAEEISQTDFNGRNPLHIFTVKGLNLPVCSLRLEGNSVIKDNEIKEGTKTIFQNPYSRSFAAAAATDSLLKIYRQRGRLRARLGIPQASPLTQGDCKEGVAVTIRVEEGVAYSWEKPQWTGNKVMAASDLEASFELKAGDTADGLKIDSGVKAVTTVYGKRGYLSAKVRVSPDYDDATHRVSYKIQIDEGAQYRMGSLTIEGYALNDADRMRKRWRLQPGDVYDASYLTDYLKSIDGITAPGGSGKSRQVKQDLNPGDKTVHLTISVK
jgi:outer membrane protein assembly factor BamA